jgi:hypothetical protein
MTIAVSAHGTLLQVGDGVSPTEGFTTIAEVLDIDGPNLQASEHDVTNHSSQGSYGESIAGRLDGGEVSFSVNWTVSATHLGSTGLTGLWEGGYRPNWLLTDRNDTVYAFAAWVKQIRPRNPVDGPARADIVLRTTGPVTITPDN